MLINVSPISFNAKLKSVAPAVSGRNLVPRSEYKLPTLKLTAEENDIIAELEKQRALIQHEITNVIQIQANSCTALKKNVYNYLMNTLTGDEEYITNMIKKIKQNRHAIQLKEFYENQKYN